MVEDFNYDDYADDDDEPLAARPAPFNIGSATSEAAADSLTPKARAQLASKVFELLLQHPRTTDEMVVLLDSENQTISPRVNDLCHAGCVQASGRIRLTRRNRRANVWMVVPGASFQMFVDWLHNTRESSPTPAGWKKKLTTAAMRYRADPTDQNGQLLLQTAREERKRS